MNMLTSVDDIHHPKNYIYDTCGSLSIRFVLTYLIGREFFSCVANSFTNSDRRRIEQGIEMS